MKKHPLIGSIFIAVVFFASCLYIGRHLLESSANISAASSKEEGHEGYSLFGIKLGEGLLALFTLLLWRATKDLVDDAKKSSRKELRAYVGVKSAFMRRASPVDPSKEILGKIVITNAGKTVAKNARVAIHIDIVDKLDGVFDIDYRAGTTYLHPGFDWNVEQKTKLPVDGKTVQQLMVNAKYVVLWGAVSYEDTYGKTRVSTFRFRQGLYVFGPTMEGWNVYPCVEGNTAD